MAHMRLEQVKEKLPVKLLPPQPGFFRRRFFSAVLSVVLVCVEAFAGAMGAGGCETQGVVAAGVALSLLALIVNAAWEILMVILDTVNRRSAPVIASCAGNTRTVAVLLMFTVRSAFLITAYATALSAPGHCIAPVTIVLLTAAGFGPFVEDAFLQHRAGSTVVPTPPPGAPPAHKEDGGETHEQELEAGAGVGVGDAAEGARDQV